ncbi:MAG: hypothetical protein Q8908_14250, partial [Bacteroidota bacterium]|nr:hypothetical protein [Bacteroidota bacterium]
TGQSVSSIRVPQANGPTAEERAEWAAERRDARLAQRHDKGIADNNQGNKAFESKNYKEAIDYYKKALRSLPNDAVVQKNLETAEKLYDLAKKQEAENKEFYKNKEPLIKDFSQPAKPDNPATRPTKSSVNSSPLYSNNIGDGALPEGQNPQIGGLTEAEWAQARDAQKQLDMLSKKWPLTAAEIALWDASLAKRNALWAKAVSVPGLSADERSRLRIKLYTRDVYASGTAPAVLSEKRYKELTAPPPLPPSASEAAPEKIQAENVNPISLKLFGTYTAEKGDALVEVLATEHAENSFEGQGIGPLAGLGRIAIAYKQDGLSSALSATGDFLVGLIPIPQASMAVEAGRAYAGVAYQLQNKFMRQALSITGQTFDEQKFWEDFDRDNGTGVKAVREWVGYGSK